MHPTKKDCWILCPSTRMPGKYYYFNVGTGEAAWTSNENERGSISRPTFTHAEHSYPEPRSPPDENAWNYHPTFRTFRSYQPMPSFSQAHFPKYLPAMVEVPQPNMAWSMPMQSPYIKPPMMNMPMFEPSWPSYAQRVKMSDKNPFPINPFEPPLNMTKSFTQPENRHMFLQKCNNLNNFKSHPLNLKRSDVDMSHVKEPLVKKMRMQEPSNETFIPNNLNGNRNCAYPLSEGSTKPKNITVEHTCNCMHSRSRDKVDSWLTKSKENLSAINQANAEQYAARKTTLSSKSSRNSIDVACSDNSSNLSLRNSFIFPLRKTESKDSGTNCCNVSKVDEPKNTKHVETGNSWDTNQVPLKDISEEDLRYVLLAKRKAGHSGNSGSQANTGRKIKLHYPENQPKEEAQKKRVTFDLGVEGDSVAGEDNELNPSEQLEPEDNVATKVDKNVKECFVIADLDVLLTDFQLLEDYVKAEPAAWLLVPHTLALAVERAGLGAGGARLANARRLARLLRDPPPYIVLQSALTAEKETESSSTEDPALACCCEMTKQGYYVVFITNNAELYNSAYALELECYTTKEIKDYIDIPKPELRFDLRRIEDAKTDKPQTNNITSLENDFPPELTRNTDAMKNDDSSLQIVPVTSTRTQLFRNSKTPDRKGFDKDNPIKESIMQRKFKQDSVKSTNDDNENDNGFLDKPSLIRDIEKLYLDQQFREKTAQTLAANKLNYFAVKKRSNSENFDEKVTGDKDMLFNDDDATVILDYAAKKKITNINIYNLNELMKGFVVKTRDVEDRILVKMDEYVCWFTQIIEDTLLDIYKDTPHADERGKSPLQNLLTQLQDANCDQRTVITLADKLIAALDCLYKHQNGRITLCLDLRPYEFMRILGYGTLLIKCLLNNDPQNARLQESDLQLCVLARGLEQGANPASPRVASPPRTPRSPCAPRDDFEKHQSEVLQYLQKHFPVWKSVRNPKIVTDTANSREKEPEGQEKPSSKIVRTTGKNLGLLKFNSRKNMVLNGHNDNKIDKTTKETTTKEKDTKKITGTKLIKKLALESSNLPPQMKEIDVEKREKINQDLLSMIDKMVSSSNISKSVTRFYDLENIIIRNSDAKFSTGSGTEPTISKSNSSPKVCEKTEKDDFKSPETSEAKTTERLDLDMLDYSDIQDSVCHANLTSDAKNSLKSQNSEVTTTQAHKVTTPVDDSQESIENIDPVLWKQGYSMIQVFLISLSKTFNTLIQFVKDSVHALRKGLPDAKKKCWYEKAVFADTTVSHLIENLKGIINRESDDETALAPFVLKYGSSADGDKRIVKYKQVVTKCLEQAEILATCIKIVKKISRDDLELKSIPDHTHEYVSLFE